jgi:hypothetical protein
MLSRLLLAAHCATTVAGGGVAPGAPPPNAAAIVVSPTTGSDGAAGTASSPFRTLERAIVAAREQQHRSAVQLRGERHYLTQALQLGPADSGLRLTSFPGENATLVGGVRLASWVATAAKGVWTHKVPPDVAGAYSRQLWVNGVRARSATGSLPGNWVFGTEPDEWGRDSSFATVYLTDNRELLHWRNPGDVEFVFHARGLFTEQRCTWASVTESSSKPGWVAVRVKQPCMLNVKVSAGGGSARADSTQTGQDPQTLPTPAQHILAKNMNVIRTENIFDAGPGIGFARSMPGTFYLDRTESTVYYKARPTDDMSTVDVLFPVLEQLIVGRGQSATRKLRNVTLSGLGFAFTTWLGPNSQDGYVPQQAAVRLVGGTTGILHGSGAHESHPAALGDMAAVTGMPCQNLNCEPTPGALSFHSVDGVVVEQCAFQHLGSAALYLGDGAQHCKVEGNEFSDISAGAVAVGRVDSWVVTEPDMQEAFNEVVGNYLHDVAVEYAGAAGVWQGFWRDSKIL